MDPTEPPDDDGPREGQCETRGCKEQGIGFNDDGVFLCENCLFEEACSPDPINEGANDVYAGDE